MISSKRSSPQKRQQPIPRPRTADLHIKLASRYHKRDPLHLKTAAAATAISPKNKDIINNIDINNISKLSGWEDIEMFSKQINEESKKLLMFDGKTDSLSSRKSLVKLVGYNNNSNIIVKEY